jgi:hypothetical protein
VGTVANVFCRYSNAARTRGRKTYEFRLSKVAYRVANLVLFPKRRWMEMSLAVAQHYSCVA